MVFPCALAQPEQLSGVLDVLGQAVELGCPVAEGIHQGEIFEESAAELNELAQLISALWVRVGCFTGFVEEGHRPVGHGFAHSNIYYTRVDSRFLG